MQKKLISSIGLLFLLVAPNKSYSQIVINPTSYIAGGGTAIGPISIPDGSSTLLTLGTDGSIDHGSTVALVINYSTPIEAHSGFSNGAQFYTHATQGFRAPQISLLKSRGTQGVPLATNSGDNIGYFNFGGYNTADGYVTGVSIQPKATETWTATGHTGATLDFYVAANDGNSIQKIITITNLGGSTGSLVLSGSSSIVSSSIYNDDTIGTKIYGTEITAPAAPAANGFVIFGQDSGGGKTQVCAKFNTGAVQCFATQP